MVVHMKRTRWELVFFIVLAILLVGCARNPNPPDKTLTGPFPVVATDVADTLTAIAPTPTTSPTVFIQNTPSITPTLTAALAPSATPVPTLLPSAVASPTPTSSPTPTASPTAALSPTAVPTNALVDLQSSSAPTPTQPAEGACIDKAGFFGDLTIPDNSLLQKSTSFIKTWRIRNVGTCTWGEGYQLVFANGHIMDGPPSSPLPKAAPGDIINISVNLKAPDEGGTYAGDWQFQNPAGRRFGVNSHGEDMIWVIIKVDWGPGIGPTPTPPPVACAYTGSPAYEDQLLQLINAARAAKQLAPLTIQSKLAAAAAVHSADMACNSYLDHTGSDGSNYSARIKSQGYTAAYSSENIYAGGDAQEAFNWWMNSQVHRDNILSPKITQIGIGYAFYSKSNYGGYYTLDFAHP
jgi:hypothetical protein